jgi:hypothetical protein
MFLRMLVRQHAIHAHPHVGGEPTGCEARLRVPAGETPMKLTACWFSGNALRYRVRGNDPVRSGADRSAWRAAEVIRDVICRDVLGPASRTSSPTSSVAPSLISRADLLAWLPEVLAATEWV